MLPINISLLEHPVEVVQEVLDKCDSSTLGAMMQLCRRVNEIMASSDIDSLRHFRLAGALHKIHAQLQMHESPFSWQPFILTQAQAERHHSGLYLRRQKLKEKSSFEVLREEAVDALSGIRTEKLGKLNLATLPSNIGLKEMVEEARSRDSIKLKVSPEPICISLIDGKWQVSIIVLFSSARVGQDQVNILTSKRLPIATLFGKRENDPVCYALKEVAGMPIDKEFKLVCRQDGNNQGLDFPGWIMKIFLEEPHIWELAPPAPSGQKQLEMLKKAQEAYIESMK